MTNEEFVRQAYAIAEVKDIPAWVDCFNPDGVFVDESVGVTYRGPSEVGKPVENYGTAFSDMHRELYDVYVSGDVVVVELALQGHTTGRSGFLRGSCRLRATEWTRRAATCFASQNGRIQLFDCYRRERSSWASSACWANLDAVLQPPPPCNCSRIPEQKEADTR